MGMYSNYTAKNQCWNCEGSKVRRHEDWNGETFTARCGVCDGTGLPSERQRHLATLEDQKLCTYCEFPEADHPDGQGSPYGCLRLVCKEVQTLKAQLARRRSTSPTTWIDLVWSLH